MSLANVDPSLKVDVSIIIPMLNARPYIEDALRSVLQEREVAIEVIVVDDGSDDGSRQLVEAFADDRIRVIDGPRKGISACLNAGLLMIRGDIVMRCDADDLYPAGRICRQVGWLAKNVEQDAVCGAFSNIDSEGRVIAQLVRRDKLPFEQIESELCRGICRTHLGTYAIRRHVFDRIGMFREYFETGEDIDFQLRMGEQARVGYVPVDDYFYRLHGVSITHSRSSRRRVFFDDVAVQFQKQRLSTGVDALKLGKPPMPPACSDASADDVSHHVHAMLVGQSWRDLANGRVLSGVDRAWRAVTTHPLHVRSWINFAKILFRATFPK